MAHQVFRLPDVGEGLTEAEILTWLVAPGDTVEVNQLIVEIETAKAAVELPCPFAGTVHQIHVQPGDIVDVGSPIITVEVSESVLVGYGVHHEPVRRRRRAVEEATQPMSARAVRAKPLVRKRARELGIDLAHITPTGRHGDVTRADVDAAAEGSARREPVRGVHRAMAAAMSVSAISAPQATIWVDVDMQRALDRAASISGVRVTPLTLVAEATVMACAKFPRINARWLDGPPAQIQWHDHVNVGIAVDTDRGLLVPSVKGAHDLTLPDLASRVNALVETARAGKCTPADLTGSTISITNVGVFGIDGGTPLLNPGESAIIGMGRIVERPWVVDGAMEIRPVMTVMMTFDHRIVDGATGSRALMSIVEELRQAT
jgi:pyruvate dehydrogenase E2 component (dihydrolipoamide acetyltransferase)